MPTYLAACDYLEDTVLDHIFTLVALDVPASPSLALSTADPGEAGSLSEPSGAGYARAPVSGLWTIDGTNRRARLATHVSFPEATGSWGTISHVALVTDSVGGQTLMRGALEGGPIAVGAGDQVGFAVDAIELAVITGWSEYLAEAILHHLLDGIAYPQPTPHVLLSTTTIGKDGSMSEPAGGDGYARIVTTPGTDWSTSALGTGEISNLVVMQTPAATGSWGTIVDSGIADAAGVGTGNLLMFGPLNAAKAIAAGKVARFLVGDLVWRVA